MKREDAKLAVAYLHRTIASVRKLSERRKEGKSSSQRALAKSLQHFIRVHEKSWHQQVPLEGNLVLIADAIWYHVRNEKYTIYIFLLRPQRGNEAAIWLPRLAQGHEDIAGWYAAFLTIPYAIRARIGAIVCDGGTGLIALAHRNNLLLQRCHFHLLAAVQNYLTTGPRSQRRLFALQVMRLVKTVVSDPAMDSVHAAFCEIKIVHAQTKSRGLKRTLGGLMLHWKEYRTYLLHPDWHLPATSNAAESCIQCIRDLLYRCRGF